MIATDLRKQQVLDTNPKTIQQINFAENLSGTNNRVMLFIIKKAREYIIGFLQETVKVL